MSLAKQRPHFDRENNVEMAGKIEKLEMEAWSLGLVTVARALNRAKNVAGWMAAGDLDRAAKQMNEDH